MKCFSFKTTWGMNEISYTLLSLFNLKILLRCALSGYSDYSGHRFCDKKRQNDWLKTSGKKSVWNHANEEGIRDVVAGIEIT